MINLDQVRTLEWKVKQAVQLIATLRKENDGLRTKLSDTEVRVQELQAQLEAFAATQSEMETGIRSALQELDHLDAAPAASVVPAPVTPEPVAYPPVTPEPVAPAPEPVVEAAVETAVADDASFEAEYAALEAEEAGLAVEPVAEPTPESVELEGEPSLVEVEEDLGPSPEETDLFDEPAAPAEKPKEAEQPGLGIF